jgi:hypothetical protein
MLPTMKTYTRNRDEVLPIPNLTTRRRSDVSFRFGLLNSQGNDSPCTWQDGKITSKHSNAYRVSI